MKIGILLLAGMVSLPLAAQAIAATEAQQTQVSHQGTGKVVSVNRESLRIKLAHEPIKSLNWPGMTMDFNVANAMLLDGIKQGDAVRFDLRQAKPGVWEIVKIKSY